MNSIKIIIICLLGFGFLSGESILDDWSGVSVDEVYQNPIDIYEKACDHNNMEACYELGAMHISNYVKDFSDDKSLKKGISYLDKSCLGGYVNGCISLGILYTTKGFEQQNDNKAVWYLDRACSAKSLFGCIATGKIYENLNKQDFTKALVYYQKACEIGADESCNYAGILYHEGKKVKQDFTKAEDLYRKSIKINSKDASSYLNIFELQLVQNIAFDKTLETKYLKDFKNNKQTMMYYDMLKILQSIFKNKSVNLQKWHKKYKGISIDGWNFDTIDIWIGQIGDEKIKTNCLNAIEQFKKH